MSGYVYGWICVVNMCTGGFVWWICVRVGLCGGYVYVLVCVVDMCRDGFVW